MSTAASSASRSARRSSPWAASAWHGTAAEFLLWLGNSLFLCA
jgi:hypothetical protein